MFRKIKYLSLIWCFIALFIGVGCGHIYRQHKLNKTVAFRVSVPEHLLDYDLWAAINYLKQQFQINGYYIAGTSFVGNLFPKELDEAKINVFIRDQNLFYDNRHCDDCYNIYYLHRVSSIMYQEELRTYDTITSSQNNFLKTLKTNAEKLFIPEGAVKHNNILKPDYKYDLLIIYEWWDSDINLLFKNNNNVKLYNSISFTQLQQEEREKLLSQAALVFYFQGLNSIDDNNYVPYAIYDIISYGRPVITNYSEALFQTMGNDVFYFYNLSDLIQNIDIALRMSNRNRENKALRAREKLLQLPNMKLPLFKK